MQVSEAVATRQSIRGFLDRPVPETVIRRVVERAARAPSGGNLQPWHIYVLAGTPLQDFKEVMKTRAAQAPRGETSEYEIYPKELGQLYKSRRFKVGEDLYGRLGIPRDDRAARRRWFASNFQLFGAPLALFCYVDRQMGPPQWSDLGMYLQTVMLLLREEGLDSCPQECWALFANIVGSFLHPPPEQMLFCGIAIGYKDPEAPANQLNADRAPLDEFAQFIGF